MAKIQSVALPSTSTASDVPKDYGASADGRKIGRSTGRDYRFSTSIPKKLHRQMKEASVRTGRPIGAIFEDAWKLWLSHNS